MFQKALNMGRRLEKKLFFFAPVIFAYLSQIFSCL